MVTYGDIIQQQTSIVQDSLYRLADRLTLIQARLAQITAENDQAQQCIDEIKKVMTTSMHTSQELQTLITQSNTRTRAYIGTCLSKPDPCVEEHKIYFDTVMNGLTLMNNGVLQYIELYDELL